MRITLHERAVKYRRLAMAEPNSAAAELLYKIAAEAERGVLVTAAWATSDSHVRETDGAQKDSQSF
jgi:BarA-like signal transduction histidine kinase